MMRRYNHTRVDYAMPAMPITITITLKTITRHLLCTFLQ
ncbi:unnamed protein product [Brassica rapa subsp. trilocularis]